MRGAGLLVGGQLGGAVVGGRRGGVPTASLGSLSGRGEAGDDCGVGRVDGCGPVPRVPVRVSVRVQGVGQRPVYLAAFPAGGGLVHRGPDQRVPHSDSVGVHHEEPRAFRQVQAARVGAEALGGGTNGGDVTGVVGRGHQQQGLNVGG